jgi:hypothetical protein
MRKLKILLKSIKLILAGYTKIERMTIYAEFGLITFEDYEKYFDNKVKKGELKWNKN